jgi:hypothetical protein
MEVKACAIGQAAAALFASAAQGRAASDIDAAHANEAFARQHGFTGTPVIVRDDGAVLHGFRPREFLETWLKEKVS